jgi:hypothetical protein
MMPYSKHPSLILLAASLGTGCTADPSRVGASQGDAGAVGSDGATRQDGGPSPSEASPRAISLYYLDFAGLVLRISPGETAPTILSDLGSSGPDGIDVDLRSGHLYWTNMGAPVLEDGFIRRSELDGSNVQTIVPSGDTHTPKQLKIDETHDKLYWSDREGMRVQRADLDGSNVETLVTIATGDDARGDEANHCVGMAVDPDGGWFYWTQKGPDNGHVGSIKRARIEMPAGEDHETRADVQVLFDRLPEPIDLDLDVATGTIYWTDRGDDTVNRAPIEIPAGMTAGSRTDREILVTGVSEAIGLTLDLEARVLYYTGLAGQLGRANLDGSGAEDLLVEERLLTGIVHAETPHL